MQAIKDRLIAAGWTVDPTWWSPQNPTVFKKDGCGFVRLYPDGRLTITPYSELNQKDVPLEDLIG